MAVSIHTRAGSVDYAVDVMWLSDYSLRDLFEKDLLFLLPFYMFNLEGEFKDYENGSGEAKGKVSSPLNKLLEQLNLLLEEKRSHQ